MVRFHKVARLSDLPPGTGRVVEVDGRPIALFNVEGVVRAVDNACPHQGGSLGEGFLKGCVVTCPLHFWQFDLATGRSPDFPEISVDRYAVKISGDEIHVSDRPLSARPAKPS